MVEINATFTYKGKKLKVNIIDFELLEVQTDDGNVFDVKDGILEYSDSEILKFD